MGWTGIKSNKWFEDVFKEEYDVSQFVKYIFVGNVLYGAIRSAQRHDLIVGIVILWRRDEDGSVMHKAIDETNGPYYYKCPYHILQLLSPLDKFEYVGHAKEWREKCYKYNGYEMSDVNQLKIFE